MPLPRTGKRKGSRGLPPPRDPEIAVREEFDQAANAATAEALERFIGRHRSHGLAERARQLLAAFRKR